MNKEKRFIILFFIFLILMIPANYLFNYIIDPFGLKSTKDKFVDQLNQQWVYLYKARVVEKAPYYLLGTSRTEQIDCDLTSNYLKKHLIYLGMSNQSLKEALFLIERIKANNNNFISGFDVIASNAYHPIKDIRVQKAFDKPDLTSQIMLNIKLKTTQESAIYLLRKIFQQERDIKFQELNKELYSYTSEKIDYKVKEDIQYKNYTVNKESQENVLKLAKLADSNDIIIIFPKLASYYKKFQEHYNIESQYFNLIKLLAENTNAKIWSFYGINEITTNKENFDNMGWHFKPKVGNLILARIFNDTSIKIPQNFGVLIDKNNVDEYLKFLHNEVKKYQLPD